MSPLDNICKSTTETLPSCSISTVAFQPNQRAINGSFKYQAKKTQFTSRNRIHNIPASGEVHLTAGEVCRQQGNLSAAMAIHKQKLLSVPPNDLQHAKLQKEFPKIPASLSEHRQMFQHLIPYDVWCSTFVKLSFRDLLRCTSVCQTWFNFIISWSAFWEKQRVELPRLKRSTLEPLIYHQVQAFWFDASLDISLVIDLLKSLAHTENHVTKKLGFNKLQLNSSDASNLAMGLRSTSRSVKQVEFIQCKIPKRKIIDPILESCSNLSHLTFSSIEEPLEHYSPTSSRAYEPNVTFASLTYLKLSFQYRTHNTKQPSIDGLRLCSNLSRCPNLVHLFLDSKSFLNQDDCIAQVQNHCPYLKNLIMTFYAEMPSTVTSQIDSKELEVSHDTMDKVHNRRAIGLSRLVLSGGHIGLIQEGVVHLFKKNYRSLNLLYVHYGQKVGPRALDKLASCGAPQLREIRLSIESSPGRVDTGPPIEQVLATLFSRCPALEAIEISDKLSCGIQPHMDGYLKTDDTVLMAIAKNCRFLRHLKIVGKRCCAQACMVHFANTGGQRLAYLEIDMAREYALEVVKKLPLLRYLHIRKDNVYPNNKGLSLDHKKAIQRILEHERGGQLTVDYIVKSV